ncbi:MAG: hypothetical protein ABI569_03160, partial [Casimicrobiaceae bacterium]
MIKVLGNPGQLVACPVTLDFLKREWIGIRVVALPALVAPLVDTIFDIECVVLAEDSFGFLDARRIGANRDPRRGNGTRGEDRTDCWNRQSHQADGEPRHAADRSAVDRPRFDAVRRIRDIGDFRSTW